MTQNFYYECTSCTYVVKAEAPKPKLLWCPMCRSNLHLIEEPADVEWTEPHLCESCKMRFQTRQSAKPPYKCTNCNFSLKSNPYKKSQERL